MAKKPYGYWKPRPLPCHRRTAAGWTTPSSAVSRWPLSGIIKCGFTMCGPFPKMAVVPSRRWILRSEEHTSELQSRGHLVCRLLLEKKKQKVELHDRVH